MYKVALFIEKGWLGRLSFSISAVAIIPAAKDKNGNAASTCFSALRMAPVAQEVGA